MRVLGYSGQRPHRGVLGAVDVPGWGDHRAHWGAGPSPHEGSQRRARVCSVQGCSGLTTLDLRVGSPHRRRSPFLSPVTTGGHCGQAGAPQPAKVRKLMPRPTAPPLGPPPGRVQTAAADTSGLFHVLWVEQALGSNEYFKHFSKMMGSPAPGRAVS